MKNEQEIVRAVFDAYIRDIKAVNEKHEPTIDMLEEVKNRAIKALEQEPCEDCVSRADVFQMIKDMQDAGDCFIGYYTYDRVKNLPPVAPAFPKNVTNGDIIMAMFPNTVWTNHINSGIHCAIGDISWLNCNENWWNSPYKRGAEND